MERKTEININMIAEDVCKYNPCFKKVVEGRTVNGRTEINMSDVYSVLIKEAAKCNYYASDLIYDIREIEERLKSFDTGNEECFEPILIGFRKMGVDGNSFVLPRVTEASKGCAYAICYPHDYFCVFAITFEKDEEYRNLGYFKVNVTGKYV